jgi:hypothetical protein
MKLAGALSKLMVVMTMWSGKGRLVQPKFAWPVCHWALYIGSYGALAFVVMILLG